MTHSPQRMVKEETSPADFAVDFDSACNLDGWVGYLLKGQAQEHVNKMRQLYQQNHFAFPKPSNGPAVVGIPKRLHQIWFGSPMPEKFRRQTDTWKHHHPEWEYRLWTDKDVPEFDSEIMKLINGTECHAQKSDILRVAILQKYGGLYVDVDYDCFRPCDVLNESFDFYSTMRGFPAVYMQFPDTFPSPLGVCSSATGSIPNHPILNAFLDQIGDRLRDKELIGPLSRLPFWGKINRMRVAIKTTYQLFQNNFAEVAGTTEFIDIALPPTFFNPIDTWWRTRWIRPAYYSHLPGILSNRDEFSKAYNLVQTYPHSFGHHDSHASWL